ncbi:MAG TPA: hypothetical protein VEM34_05820 [Burkholderiales bacterium]|nr:hypothetical protein [Burkholderiales bacterium]
MTPGDLGRLAAQFFDAVGRKEIEIYNEFSLQHEFGIWLREQNDNPTTKIQFERPASFFGVAKKLTKKEIDLACFISPVDTQLAMEFKFPRSGQVPIQMFKFCQDVAFLEELVLKEKRFPFGCALFTADDPDFYRGTRQQSGTIYSCFRDGVTLRGKIEKSTGKEEPPVVLLREYKIEWRTVQGMSEMRFALIQVTQ